MQTSLRPAIFPLRMQAPIASMAAAAPVAPTLAMQDATPDMVTFSTPAPSPSVATPTPSPSPATPVPAPVVHESVEEMLARTNREIREMQFTTKAAALEVTKKGLETWQTQNPWNTLATGLPAAGAFVWALGKKLTKAQKGTMKDLIKAGIPAGYARQLVERGEGDMIGYMLAHPAKKKK